MDQSRFTRTRHSRLERCFGLWTVHFANDAVESFMAILGAIRFTPTHEDDIGSLFTLRPNTHYWLSLVPKMAFPPQWALGTGALGDDLAHQRYFRVASPLNRAGVRYSSHAHSGAVEPKPSSYGVGVVGLASVLRRAFRPIASCRSSWRVMFDPPQVRMPTPGGNFPQLPSRAAKRHRRYLSQPAQLRVRKSSIGQSNDSRSLAIQKVIGNSERNWSSGGN
jgi:hypothetical protein